MTKQDIKENIAILAQSQGFYGRLFNQIEEDEAVTWLSSWEINSRRLGKYCRYGHLYWKLKSKGNKKYYW